MRSMGPRLRFSSGPALTERVEAENGDPGDWRFLRTPRPPGLHRHPVDLHRRLPPQLALQARDDRHVVLRRGRTARQLLLLPGVVAVYGGMVLFVRVWFGLYQTLRARPGVPIRSLADMFALWIVPLLVVAPLFSRDVFSYAAQGEMMSHHINPYNYGPGTLGSGPYVTGVDGLWLNTPAPYGPFFLMLAGWAASLELPQCAGHRPVPAPDVGGGRGPHRLLHPQAGPGLRA